MATIEFSVTPYQDPPPPCSDGERRWLVNARELGWQLFDERDGDPSDEAFYSQMVPWEQGDPPLLTEIGVIISRRGNPIDPQGYPAKLTIGISRVAPPSNPHINDEFLHYGEIYPSDLPETDDYYWVYGTFPAVNIEGTQAFITITTNTAVTDGSLDRYVWWAQQDACNGNFPCAVVWDDNSPPWHDTTPYISRMCFYSCSKQVSIPPTAFIDAPMDGATIENPISFVGHGQSNSGGQITNYEWLDGDIFLSDKPAFTASLSAGQHVISFAVYCNIGGWSPYAQVSITVTEPQICTEGDTQCVGYDLYECRGEQWVKIETNSEQCGYVCTDGTEKCIDGYINTCTNNEWVPTSETCTDYLSYLPYIIAGIGGVLILAALVMPSRAPTYPQPYPYPPYYPPPQYPPYYPPYPRR